MVTGPGRGHRGMGGFTLLELLVSLYLLSAIALFILQVFIAGLFHSGRANERAAATMLASQVMEQVRASVNPYTMVGFTGLARSPLPLPAPYDAVQNPSPYPLEVAVLVAPDDALTLRTVTVQVFRVGDTAPLVTLGTLLDDN
ncbi:MAG: prepilin-type N-terminal cleavage/methylation domain-containing protein [Armatimonadota bacterium]|nr:prepilin-type N-terminal cleavage/methylation domain-containing protein [Armatimonadota bacterium]MDR7449407.1 prepilin-type N-terminal cleavage/methylation domain-containing protein [Armatimonadota bacterium]MDR7480251.1 prepilin-type N-terminal cleavage/methylation domain-containing protein [Armatimonadota bacterium]MDR7528549.1 prepilin-type N-terminal cleavage/methylation domain-containing protein [Armatimonadota bacterium]